MTDEPTSAVEAHLASIAASLTTLVEENRDLRVRLDDAIVRIDAQNELIRRRTNAYKVTVAAFVAVLVAFGWIILDNQRAIQENNRNFCAIVGVNATGPRTSQIGVWLRDSSAELLGKLGCTTKDLENVPRFEPTPSPTPTSSPGPGRTSGAGQD